jgi:hypothetical protein
MVDLLKSIGREVVWTAMLPFVLLSRIADALERLAERQEESEPGSLYASYGFTPEEIESDD